MFLQTECNGAVLTCLQQKHWKEGVGVQVRKLLNTNAVCYYTVSLQGLYCLLWHLWGLYFLTLTFLWVIAFPETCCGYCWSLSLRDLTLTGGYCWPWGILGTNSGTGTNAGGYYCCPGHQLWCLIYSHIFFRVQATLESVPSTIKTCGRIINVNSFDSFDTLMTQPPD